LWLDQATVEVLKVLAQNSPSMYLASTVDGRILWANDAFCEWSKYTVIELQKKTWIEISRQDEDLQADIELVKTLTQYQLSYTVQKRYIPKNGKPELGNLTVIRYPATGEIEFCWCRWEPLVNGTAQAFELALESQQKMTQSMSELATEVKTLTKQSEEETFFLAMIRMTMKYPKTATAALASLLALGGADAAISTLQRLGFLSPPPVQVVREVDK
jgi:PAS domain S-box-containing protein